MRYRLSMLIRKITGRPARCVERIAPYTASGR